jgi:hypothetical protein
MQELGGDGRVVALELEGSAIYLVVQEVSAKKTIGDESEIAARRPSLDGVLNGLTALARRMGSQLSDTGASTVSVEFGCEFAVESGTLVAVVGKASAKSAFKVGLEWTRPTP